MSLLGGGIGGGTLPGGGGTTTLPGSAVPPGNFTPSYTGQLSPQLINLLNAKHGSVRNFLRLRNLGYV